MKKFTFEQIKKKVGEKDMELVEKVFLLANGLIVVHGYDDDEAFKKAMDIAHEWLDNGRKYVN